MQPARPAAIPTLHDGGSFDPEFERTLRITNPGAALRRALTFSPREGEWMSSWEAWREQTLEPKLAPALMSAAELAGRGAARELLALDLQLHATLEPAAAERSVLAGKRLLRQLSGARGERFVAKLQAWSDDGSLPTHFLTIYAAQSALFHLSLRLLLPGYAYWEWTAAGGDATEFSQAVPGLQRAVQAALTSHVFHAIQPLAPAAGDA